MWGRNDPTDGGVDNSVTSWLFCSADTDSAAVTLRLWSDISEPAVNAGDKMCFGMHIV